MNERLKALMLEAGYAAPELATRGQLLAELIVRECADIAAEKKTQYEQATKDFEYESPDWFWATRTTQALRCVEADIKQHFEVGQ